MSRNRQGTKSTRIEENARFQALLRERKRLRKQRAEQFAHLFIQRPAAGAVMKHASAVASAKKSSEEAELSKLQMGPLREIAREHGVKVRSRMRKVELVQEIMRAKR